MYCIIEADRHQSAEWKARKKAYQEDLARWQKLSQPGQAKRTRSERTQREVAGAEPAWDPFPDMRISPASQASRLWEGCVRPDRLPFEQLASQLQGLVIGTPDTKTVKPGMGRGLPRSRLTGAPKRLKAAMGCKGVQEGRARGHPYLPVQPDQTGGANYPRGNHHQELLTGCRGQLQLC
jgi:hypothetical protein